MERTCHVCESEYRERIEGWILSGTRMETIVEWCRLLEPPVPASRDSLGDHLNSHLDITKNSVVAMLVKFGTEANDVIQDALGGGARYPRNAINTAMAMRMRAIELVGKAVGVLDAGPRQVKQELNVLLPKDVQRQMLVTAFRQLDTPADKLDSGTSVPSSPIGGDDKPESTADGTEPQRTTCEPSSE